VTASCLEGDDLVDIDAETTVLSDACARFGPNPPPADGDAPALRPADPDPTGGYFLPVRAEVNGVDAFGAQRIRCDLAGATREVFEAFQMDYEANRHPEIVAFTPDRSVSVDEVVDLVVQVSPDSEEAYVVYVPEASTLQEATEELTASWYMTSGTLSRGSEILGGGAATTRWTAPKAPGPVYGWVVVRDSRGGMAWEGFTVEVEPSG